MIELVHLEKKYNRSTPLKDVNAVINEGDVISVIGPSGTGKSTLIRCINLLEKPTGGKILLDGVDITAPDYPSQKARIRMGMVFQAFNLFGHLTVIENLMAAPIDLLKKSKQEAYDTGIELLKRVGLSGRELKYPHQLSGGQKQRVAIARTLAMDPDMIFFDEPTSSLDSSMVGEVQAVIRSLASSGKTMMVVTHEMSFARAVCNRVFYMDQGEIYEDGPPEQVFDNPKRERTRRFVRQLKILEFNIDNLEFDFITAGDEINRYCFQHDVAPRIKYRIHLAFEELLQQMLSGVLEEETINVMIEYSPKEESVDMKFKYGGVQFDPINDEDSLSSKVLKGLVDDINYEFDSDNNYSNVINVLIRG